MKKYNKYERSDSTSMMKKKKKVSTYFSKYIFKRAGCLWLFLDNLNLHKRRALYKNVGKHSKS